MKNTTDNKLVCSFCNANESDVRFLVEGESAYICEACIEKANQIVNDSQSSSSLKIDFNNQKPKDLKNMLDEYVIGQDEVKK